MANKPKSAQLNEKQSHTNHTSQNNPQKPINNWYLPVHNQHLPIHKPPSVPVGKKQLVKIRTISGKKNNAGHIARH